MIKVFTQTSTGRALIDWQRGAPKVVAI